MRKYIYQQKNWPDFNWDSSQLAALLAHAHQRQGQLIGRMQGLGFNLNEEALLQSLTLEIVKNSEIENVMLNADQVRSSISQRLGIPIGPLTPPDRNVDGIVEMMLDATQHFNQALTKKRILAWHAALFPIPYSGMKPIIVANWRTAPMQVISGPIGRERIHFEALPARLLDKEMKQFLNWFNTENSLDPILKAAIAHLWFVTIHPFDDGNGRIARTITDLQLARADGSAQRFYSMSAQIQKERASYYTILEKTQKNNLDITPWLTWFLTCLNNALIATETHLADILNKAQFWQAHSTTAFNERQQRMLNKMFEGFYGKLTSSKWAKINKCSQDTALRDIQDLLDRGILIKDNAGGRSTNYLMGALWKK